MSDSKKIDYIQSKVDSVSEQVASIDKDMALQKAALEIRTKQDEKLHEEFKRMNNNLQEYNLSLQEHMQQTMLLKEMVVKMDERLSPIEIDYIQKAAVREWILKNTKFIIKVCGALSALGGIGFAILKFLGHF
jgi:hypothetical protein